MRGPIDYIIVKFPGNKFKGEILSELKKSIENGTIAVLDLALIVKDKTGQVSAVALSEIDDSVVVEFASNITSAGLIEDDDTEEVAELLEENSSAGLLVIEHLWAKGLKQAIQNVDGQLIAEGRIHPDAYNEIDK